MDDQPHELTIEELTNLGLYDAAAPGAVDRLELLRYVLARGATVEQIARSRSLGDLALDLNLRTGPWFELSQVVSSTDLEWDDAERLLTALGLPACPDDLVTAEEAAAIQLLGAASTRLLGPEVTIQVARVAGTAMARVAEVLVGAFRLRFELPRLQGGSAYSDVVKEYSDLTEQVLPGFVQTLDVLLRRQLVAVADRVWSTDAEQIGRHPASHHRLCRPRRLYRRLGHDVRRGAGSRARRVRRTSDRNRTPRQRSVGEDARRRGDVRQRISQRRLPDRAPLRSRTSRLARFHQYESAWRLATFCPCSVTSTDPTSTWPLAWSARRIRRRWSYLSQCETSAPLSSDLRPWIR